jgi:hypothetical protein
VRVLRSFGARDLPAGFRSLTRPDRAVEIEIKIGGGKFEGTAGYDPNETAAVASIPCNGAGQSIVQLRGCTEDDECATSEAKTVTITGEPAGPTAAAQARQDVDVDRWPRPGGCGARSWLGRRRRALS